MNDVEPFTVEELIARSVSVFEELIDKFEMQDWHQILDQYYTYWLHRHVVIMSLLTYSCHEPFMQTFVLLYRSCISMHKFIGSSTAVLVLTR